MRPIISLLALALVGSSAAAQPGQIYDPNAPQGPPPDVAPQQPYSRPAPYPAAQPMPYPAAQPAPDATRATFVSTGETRWDVRIDGNAVCTTPCSLMVEPMRFITLHSQAAAPTKLEVGHMPPGEVLVSAKPRAQGAFAAGVTFTALSGMALATGITLTAVGYGTDRDTMAKAGMITGVAGAVGLYLSIGVIRSAMPRVRVERGAQPYVGSNTVGVAGTF